MKKTLIKKKSAWIPVLMSILALILIIGHIAMGRIPSTPPNDEGTAAHIFQLLMAGQLPIVAYFVIKWLPKRPTQAIGVLALQFVAGASAFALIYFLEL